MITSASNVPPGSLIRRLGEAAADNGLRPFPTSGALTCLLGDRAERGRVADREIGEDLAVELDVRLAAAGDELVVREAVLGWRRR